jgi:hypothetical protein
MKLALIFSAKAKEITFDIDRAMMIILVSAVSEHGRSLFLSSFHPSPTKVS